MIHSTSDAALIDAADVRHLAALVDYERIKLLLAYFDGKDDSGWGFHGDLAAMGEALGWSQHTTRSRLHEAREVNEKLPRAWLAFSEGRINAARVSEIGRNLDALHHEQSLERLDARVADYAEHHTLAELRAWIKRFIARAEPEHADERTASTLQERHVRVIHHETSSTGDLWVANVPSLLLADIENKLDHAAKAIRDDERTLDQRRADLALAVLGSVDPADDGPIAPAVAIGVMVPASTLAGLDDQPGISWDRQWTLPATAVRELVSAGNPFWYRLLVDERENILSIDYTGRFPSHHLRNAIRFRDGTCRFPGCQVRGTRCEIDHRRPHPLGPTHGDNMWLLCKQHHQMKTFRAIEPSDDGSRWHVRQTILTA